MNNKRVARKKVRGASTPMRRGGVPWYLVAGGLALLVLCVYWQVGRYAFVNFDDDLYVYENPMVLKGLTPESISWAFTTSRSDNWYPLTWMSYMADIEMFGLDPGSFHRMNALLHLVNTTLLFLVLHRMTGGMWRSAFVAALFGVHPLHVESVAWIAERKDVLSTLFWMLTLWAYLRYARRPSVARYFPVAVFLGLGLMSKPMLVTVPFVLLLLDWWPLGRLSREDSTVVWSWRSSLARFGRLVWEKAPLLGMSAMSGVITYVVQAKSGTTSLIAGLSFGSRVANAVVAYASYIWKLLWPSSLAAFYPHPASVQASIPAWAIAGSTGLICGLTILVLRYRHRQPYLGMGWLWYLGTLVPVIGLIQTGSHAMADRFTYVPSIGVFIAVAWGSPAALAARGFRRAALAACGGAVVLALSVAAWKQVGYWQDSPKLWSRAIAVTDRNWLATNNLGDYWFRRGEYQQALGYFQEALRFRPDYGDALKNLGVSYQALGQYQQAVGYFQRVLRIKPEGVSVWRDLGDSYFKLDQYREATAAYREWLRVKPDDAETWNLLGVSYGTLGQYQDAIGCFQRALQIRPDYADTRNNLATANARLSQRNDASAKMPGAGR